MPDSTSLQPEVSPPIDLSGFEDIAGQLRDLARGEEADDFGVLRPTDHAFRRTMEILSGALKMMLQGAVRRGEACVFPAGCATTDEQGGLRIEWFDDQRAIHLVVAADKGGRSYVYHENGDTYGTNDRVTGRVLANWLSKLFG